MRRKNPVGRGLDPETRLQIEGTPLPGPKPALQQANSLHGDMGLDGPPSAREIQEGITIMRLPDVAFQPEGGRAVFEHVPQSLCPSGFTGTNNFTTIISFRIPPSTKLIIVDAWVGFTNPFVADITEAVLFAAGVAIPKLPRIQYQECCYPGIRASIVGTSNVDFKIKRETLTTGWKYGYFQAFIKGWLVPDLFFADMRGKK